MMNEYDFLLRPSKDSKFLCVFKEAVSSGDIVRADELIYDLKAKDVTAAFSFVCKIAVNCPYKELALSLIRRGAEDYGYLPADRSDWIDVMADAVYRGPIQTLKHAEHIHQNMPAVYKRALGQLAADLGGNITGEGFLQRLYYADPFFRDGVQERPALRMAALEALLLTPLARIINDYLLTVFVT